MVQDITQNTIKNFLLFYQKQGNNATTLNSKLQRIKTFLDYMVECGEGLKKVLLTGIRYTMQSDDYPKGLAKHDIKASCRTMSKEEIKDIILGELCRGIILDDTR